MPRKVQLIDFWTRPAQGSVRHIAFAPAEVAFALR